MQPVLPNKDQNDRNLVIAYCALCLAQGSIILCRYVKLGTIKSYLEVVSGVAIELKQLKPLKINCGIKDQCIDTVLAKVKQSIVKLGEPITIKMVLFM